MYIQVENYFSSPTLNRLFHTMYEVLFKDQYDFYMCYQESLEALI